MIALIILLLPLVVVLIKAQKNAGEKPNNPPRKTEKCTDQTDKRQVEKIKRAREDLPYLKRRISKLYSMLDVLELELYESFSAKNQLKIQRQINTIESQIHQAERQYRQAKQILQDSEE